VRESRAQRRLVCLSIVVATALSLCGAIVGASPADGVSSQPNSDLCAPGANSPGVSLMGGWNLISLPIAPFDTSIESVLAPLAYPYDLVSVWHYDRCKDEWLVYGEGHTSLRTIEDGKAYWVRMRYPEEQHPDPAVSGTYPYTLWVFGTTSPMPPGLPSAYDVCVGWNMVGFRSVAEMAPHEYLSSFGSSDYGAIYGWDSYRQHWITRPDRLVPGRGYWIPFSVAGKVHP